MMSELITAREPPSPTGPRVVRRVMVHDRSPPRHEQLVGCALLMFNERGLLDTARAWGEVCRHRRSISSTPHHLAISYSPDVRVFKFSPKFLRPRGEEDNTGRIRLEHFRSLTFPRHKTHSMSRPKPGSDKMGSDRTQMRTRLHRVHGHSSVQPLRLRRGKIWPSTTSGLGAPTPTQPESSLLLSEPFHVEGFPLPKRVRACVHACVCV